MMEKLTKLETLNHRPKVLLLGNGVNRAFGTESWGDILSEISAVSFDEIEKMMVDNLTFPLQTVIYTNDNVDEGVKLLSEKLTNMEVSEEYSEIIESYLDMGFDAILTTNYTYDIEKGIEKSFCCRPGCASKYRKRTFVGNSADEQMGLFKCIQIKGKNIWHIHGEAAIESSMILGHYYYGKLLSCMQKYISTLIRRYKGMKQNGKFRPLSWIDYFMLGDVYIVGLGLDQSEIDLWWLLNCKKRHKKTLDSGKVYWIEPNLKDKSSFARYMLAEVNDIEVITNKVKNTQYKNYYKSISKIFEKYIDE